MPTGTDTKKQFTQEERAAFIKDYRASGLSKMAFVKDKPFHYNTFNAWLSAKGKKMARKNKASKKTTKRNGRTAVASGRYVERPESPPSLPAARGRQNVDELGVSELRELVRLQASVLARYI